MWVIGALVALAVGLATVPVSRLRYRRLQVRSSSSAVAAEARPGVDPAAAAISLVDRAAALLRVGMPPAAVLEHVARICPDAGLGEVLRKAAASLRLGENPDQALRRHIGGVPQDCAEILEGMAAVWFVAQSAGAPAADMLENYARGCRDRVEAAAEREVALAGPRSTVLVLTWLPVASLGLAFVVGAGPVDILMSVPSMLSVLAGIVLLVVGRVWMSRMLRAAQ